ncbi:4-alpha-glucanotransferase [Solimonas soli]|uniref:4-alpha-glucanotransferase n=1 Tax=Solimonas soli TaxID=413479 RepID=UPI0004B80CBF|nr:4-alpha-glucanotransferase [Solimonas soli]
MSSDLQRLAANAGIALRWIDYRGAPQEVGEASLRALLGALDLPCATPAQIRDSEARLSIEAAMLPPLLTAVSGGSLFVPSPALSGRRLPLHLEAGGKTELLFEAEAGGACAHIAVAPGYHRLELPAGEALTIAVAPPRAFGVRDVRGAAPRVWGLAAQIYALRRRGDAGIGDFTALADFAERCAAAGADALAVSPVHALFSADVHHFSPYAPSSRLFLNVLHADPALLLGSGPWQELVAELGLGDELARLEALSLVDWPASGRVRLALLRAAFARLAPRLGAGDPLGEEFAAFVRAGGEALLDHARFEVLHAQQFAAGRWSWREWPQALRDPRAPAVAEAAAAQPEELRFHLFAQWLAARGLAQAQRAAREAGMAIGLIGDLAVGTDASGSHAWSRQTEMLDGVSAGAPPDMLNALGQSWGLAAFSPRALRRHGYGAFLEMLRAALRHVGGLRIDHVLGLMRLWLVPQGATAREGAYLHCPFQDLLRLVALESHRHRAVIVGEDLGTVPEGIREALYGAGLMGMRVLWFERDHGLFVEPARWPREAMATTTTHDLPTVAGWWAGRDIDWRERLALFAPGSDAAREHAERAEERRKLWGALRYAGVADGEAVPAPDDAAPVIGAALRFVARTPAELAIVPVEDIAGLVEQPNLPGTTREHPNWQRRLPAEASELFAAPEAQQRLAALASERPATR